MDVVPYASETSQRKQRGSLAVVFRERVHTDEETLTNTIDDKAVSLADDKAGDSFSRDCIVFGSQIPCFSVLTTICESAASVATGKSRCHVFA